MLFDGLKQIVLAHRISKKGIEVDKVNIEVIQKFPPPISVKNIHSFGDIQVSIDNSSRTFLKL